MSLPSFAASFPPRVLVIGDLMLDRYLWGACDRVSPEAPVQVVQVKRESYSLGGAGNVVANLCSLGARAALLAVVGRDAAQTPLEQLLRELAVETRGLIQDDSRPTTVKTRILAAHHQLLRFDVESTQPCSDEAADKILTGLRARMATTDVVVLSDYAKGVLTQPLVRELISECKRAGLPVLVDPKARDYSHYGGATLLTPNRKEAAAATGLALDDAPGVLAAGRKLVQDLALDACLITLSEDGMALIQDRHGHQAHHLPTQAREVFDVTGAGDTVIATIAFGLGAGLSLLEACQLANRAAGIVVGKLGAATVRLSELIETARPAAHATSTAERPSEAKLVSRDALLAELAQLRAASRKIVFTNGCFDLLHAGHVQYLTQAARLGDVLVVGLNSDSSVRRLKGSSRPLNGEHDRAQVLAALAAVGFVTVFAEDTPLELIVQLSPDVLVKGGDYKADDIVGADHVHARGGRVVVLPFVEGRSTTQLLARALLQEEAT